MNTREDNTIAIARVIMEAHCRFDHGPRAIPRSSIEWTRILTEAHEALHGLSADAQSLERRCNAAESRAHDAEAQLIAVARESKALADRFADARGNACFQSKRADDIYAHLGEVESQLARTRHDLAELRGDYAASEAWRKGANRDLERARQEMDEVRSSLGVPDEMDTLAYVRWLKDNTHTPNERKAMALIESVASGIRRKRGRRARRLLKAAAAWAHAIGGVVDVEYDELLASALSFGASANRVRKAKART